MGRERSEQVGGKFCYLDRPELFVLMVFFFLLDMYVSAFAEI